MGTIWVKEFTGGLDTRRMAETTPGGLLVQADNGHITRGGEFEKRAAFTRRYFLPAGTVGLAQNTRQLVVFGQGVRPASLPSDLHYVQLTVPNGARVTRILDFDVFEGIMYAVAEFADGQRAHFYGGQRVTEWFDGRARLTLRITGGYVREATAATGSFRVTGGTAAPENTYTVRVGGVKICNAVTDTGSVVNTAASIAAAINTFSSDPEYSATVSGATVIIKSDVLGAVANGRPLAIELTGDATVTAVQGAMSGGIDRVASSINALRVAGVDVIGSAVEWATSNEDTAEALAEAINAKVSSPEYVATVDGVQVNIVAAAPGADANGRIVTWEVANGLTYTQGNGGALSDGANLDTSYQPGSTARTIGAKMYSVSGRNLHFSGIKAPTKWRTDTVGAGFVDMGSQTSNVDELRAVRTYENSIAIFGVDSTQIWYVDPDPTLNRQLQVLNNTGAVSARAITPFGDSDLLYLDKSGLRSLRARENSSSATTSDIGVPVDKTIVAKMRSLTEEEQSRIYGLVNPDDGRFWLIMKDEIFVFSYFANAKVSAWTRYFPTVTGPLYNAGLFPIDDAVVFKRKIYIRSGDEILVFGGPDQELTYDYTRAIALLPFLDANVPSEKKQWSALDVAVEGDWGVAMAQDHRAEGFDPIGRVSETTFEENRIPLRGRSTHLALLFQSWGNTPNILSSVVIGYEGADDES